MGRERAPTTTAQVPTSIDVESLLHLDGQLRRERGHRVLLPVDEKWYELVHGAEDRVRRPSGAAIAADMARLAAQPPTKVASAVISKLMSVIPGSRPGEFMGPMCCPMSKIDVATVRDPKNKYLVSEKSDGLRALSLSVLEEDFPRWTVVSDVPTPEGVPAAPNVSKSLYDGSLLEAAFVSILESGAVSKHGIQLSTGTCSLLLSEDGDTHTLRSATGEKIRVRRTKEPRHFTYFIDRSMRAVCLFLEEVSFPTDLTDLVLDGELIFSFARGRPQCFYSCFDVLSWENVTRGPNGTISASREFLVDASMSERYALIHDRVLGPMHALARATGRPLPVGIAIIRKHMVPVHDLGQLLGEIHCLDPQSTPSADNAPVPKGSDGDRRYFFRQTASFNDGLIFTPDKFDVCAGSCPTQFKWKWPAKLSVDFLLSEAPASDPIDQCDGVAQRVSLELFFRQRAKSSAFEEKSGHVFFANEVVYNPMRFDLRKKVVAECSLARGAASNQVRWRIDKLRQDKTEANAAISAFSVLESICENLTVEELARQLGLTLPASLIERFRILAPEGGPTATDRDPASILLPRMIVRARLVDGIAKPFLQWQIRLADMKKGALYCNHRAVSACYGLGEGCPDANAASCLVGRVLLETANNGGCVGWSDTTVETAFDSASGRWAITSVSGNKDLKTSAFANSVFGHLSAVAKWVVSTGGEAPRLKQLEAAAPQVISPEVLAMMKEMGLATDATPQTSASDAHYAQRTRELAASDGQRSALRHHNNWVKLVTLHQSAALARKARGGQQAADARLAVLDLCAGRGGDLQKYRYMSLRHVVLIDSCFEAIAEAAGRYSVGSGLSTCTVDRDHPGVPMSFFVGDCFDDARLLPRLRLELAARNMSATDFDLVSCQFSMHYAFGDINKVRGFLRIVSECLRDGGIFVATTVDDEALASWRSRCGDSFGNAAFHVSFLQPQPPGCYGEAYRISVENSVVDEIEWIVDWKSFVALADTFSLQVIESRNFQAVQETDGTDDQLEAMLSGTQRNHDLPESGKRGRQTSGRSEMTPDQAAAAALFRTIIMRKTPRVV